MIFLGTIVNSAVVIIGSVIGVLLSGILTKSKKFASLPNIIMKAVGLCVIYIGISGVISAQASASQPRELGGVGAFALLIMIGCIVIGTLIGELIDIDKYLDKFGKFIERKLTKKKYDENGQQIVQDRGIAKGFVSATLLFCVGAMAITGAIESGLSHGTNQATLFAKSTLDFISSIVFGSTLGIGSALASISVLIYQGVIELFAIFIGNFLPNVVIWEMSSTGSLIIFGLGLNMIGVSNFKIANMLPSIFLPLIMCLFI